MCVCVAAAAALAAALAAAASRERLERERAGGRESAGTESFLTKGRLRMSMLLCWSHCLWAKS